MGVLPLLVPESMREGFQQLVHGNTVDIVARAAVATELEVALRRSGGVIPHLLRSTIDAAPPHRS